MIPRDLFERYEAALGANARLLQAAMARAAELIDGGGATWDEAYAALVGQYGRFAAAVAVEFYQALRDAADPGRPYEALAFERDDARELAGDLARAAGAGAEELLAALQASARRRVMERADEVLLRNALADPAHPKWALVPHAGACAWCRFLGSQSFTYNSRAKALASRHDNCLCTPVVDFDADNPRLDGYDPAAYREEYADARAAAEEAAREDWQAMSAAERASYAAKGRGAYDHFLRNRIVQEMART